jgi:hypothetical protein
VVNSNNSGAQDTISSKFGSNNDFHLTSLTEKAISKVVDLRLDRSWWISKENSKIYKVISHENFLISTFTRSKEPPFASRSNGDFPVQTVVHSSSCIV